MASPFFIFVPDFLQTYYLAMSIVAHFRADRGRDLLDIAPYESVYIRSSFNFDGFMHGLYTSASHLQVVTREVMRHFDFAFNKAKISQALFRRKSSL